MNYQDIKICGIFTLLIDTFSVLKKIFTVACVLSFTGSVYYKNRFVKAKLFIFPIPIRQEFFSSLAQADILWLVTLTLGSEIFFFVMKYLKETWIEFLHADDGYRNILHVICFVVHKTAFFLGSHSILQDAIKWPSQT